MTKNIKNVGTKLRPRVSVFRSNKGIYAQAIDDQNGRTLFSSASYEVKDKKKPSEIAFIVGENLAKNAKDKKVSEIVFDRNQYRYHGRVKALAEGIRKGGIKF